MHKGIIIRPIGKEISILLQQWVHACMHRISICIISEARLFVFSIKIYKLHYTESNCLKKMFVNKYLLKNYREVGDQS